MFGMMLVGMFSVLGMIFSSRLGEFLGSIGVNAFGASALTSAYLVGALFIGLLAEEPLRLLFHAVFDEGYELPLTPRLSWYPHAAWQRAGFAAFTILFVLPAAFEVTRYLQPLLFPGPVAQAFPRFTFFCVSALTGPVTFGVIFGAARAIEGVNERLEQRQRKTLDQVHQAAPPPTSRPEQFTSPIGASKVQLDLGAIPERWTVRGGGARS